MLPRSHAWSRSQKWLILACVVLGVASRTALIYTYEGHHPTKDDDAVIASFDKGWSYGR
ncbi:MAG TPA: hypothetical protein VGW39_02405 [Chthoniobacterales bacterium]|nr:hypothetical protein [Chthoniobacterales bacterium]